MGMVMALAMNAGQIEGHYIATGILLTYVMDAYEQTLTVKKGNVLAVHIIAIAKYFQTIQIFGTPPTNQKKNFNKNKVLV